VVWIKIPATKIKPLNFKYKGKTTEKNGIFRETYKTYRYTKIIKIEKILRE
jgi:hypothetical protein